MIDIDFEIYDRMADELAEDDERSRYVDTTNEPEFLLMKIAALKKQKDILEKQIDGFEQLVQLAR